MFRALVLILIVQFCTLYVSAEPLKATIEETRTFEQWQNAVLPTIKVGALWSDEMLPRIHTDELWFRVPSWKAGELQGETATEYEIKDGQLHLLGMHKNRFDLLAGQQKDAQGGIWHCARFPNVATVETDDRLVTVIGLASKHSQHSSEREIVHERSIEIARSKETGRILSVRELRSLAKWTPQEGNYLLFEQQTLGEDGVPVKEGRVIVSRVAPFQRVDRLSDGFDLHQSFRRFLLSQGMKDLLPPY